MENKNMDKYAYIPKNYLDFRLVMNPNAKPEDYGYTKEQVLELLDMLQSIVAIISLSSMQSLITMSRRFWYIFESEITFSSFKMRS